VICEDGPVHFLFWAMDAKTETIMCACLSCEEEANSMVMVAPFSETIPFCHSHKRETYFLLQGISNGTYFWAGIDSGENKKMEFLLRKGLEVSIEFLKGFFLSYSIGFLEYFKLVKAEFRAQFTWLLEEWEDCLTNKEKEV
jgi:hypothetical protein